jgi:hypothetical protein
LLPPLLQCLKQRSKAISRSVKDLFRAMARKLHSPGRGRTRVRGTYRTPHGRRRKGKGQSKP